MIVFVKIHYCSHPGKKIQMMHMWIYIGLHVLAAGGPTPNKTCEQMELMMVIPL